MLPIFALIALVSFISVNVYISRRGKNRRREVGAPVVDPATLAIVERVWMDVAEERGLTVDAAGTLGIRGDTEEVPCEMELGERPDGISTIARAHRIPEVTHKLEIAPVDLEGKVLRLFRGKSKGVGDAAFDEAFASTAEPERLLMAALDEPSRETLLLFRPRNPHLTYDGSTVELTMDGAVLMHDDLHAIFELLVHVAKLPAGE